ncbi:MAG: amino acid transport protein [bacterium]
MDLNSILVGVFISLVGLALLMYGRKQTRLPHMVVGLILIVYPYFVGSIVIQLAVAVVLLAALALASRLGL